MAKWEFDKEVSPAKALERAREVAQRPATTKLLNVAVAAMREVANGTRAEVTIGGGEATAILAQLIVLESRAKAAESKAAQMERDRNTARAEVSDLATEVKANRAEIEKWMARGAELLGKPA